MLIYLRSYIGFEPRQTCSRAHNLNYNCIAFLLSEKALEAQGNVPLSLKNKWMNRNLWESYDNAYSEALWYAFIESKVNGIIRPKSGWDIVFSSSHQWFPANLLTCAKKRKKRMFQRHQWFSANLLTCKKKKMFQRHYFEYLTNSNAKSNSSGQDSHYYVE